MTIVVFLPFHSSTAFMKTSLKPRQVRPRVNPHVRKTLCHPQPMLCDSCTATKTPNNAKMVLFHWQIIDVWLAFFIFCEKFVKNCICMGFLNQMELLWSTGHQSLGIVWQLGARQLKSALTGLQCFLIQSASNWETTIRIKVSDWIPAKLLAISITSVFSWHKLGWLVFVSELQMSQNVPAIQKQPTPFSTSDAKHVI